MAFPFLERMEVPAPVRAARYRHPLASGGFSPLLEMEEPPYKSWPKDHGAGHHFSHSGHESGQSVVGRTPHPQRVVQAGPHVGPTNRRQIHGPQTSSFPDPELENVPAQSPGANGLGQFSHGAHPELPTSLRFCGLVAPAPKSAALLRRPGSLRPLDGPTVARSLPVHLATHIAAPGPGRHLRLGIPALCGGHRVGETANCTLPEPGNLPMWSDSSAPFGASARTMCWC